MIENVKNPAIKASLLASIVAGAACYENDESQRSAPVLDWQPVISLNGDLPDAVTVYSARDETFPLRAWYVRIDESKPQVETRVVLSDDLEDRRETGSSFSEDENACVVVNGGYFSMETTPAVHGGLLLQGGEMLAPATRRVVRDSIEYESARAAIGFTDEGEVDIAWVTSREGELYQWESPPAHRQGSPAPPLDYDAASPWMVRDALSAGPVLIMGGATRITSDEEIFFLSSIPDVHPRTAAGVTEDGELILVVVDGRQPESRGVDLEELADIMLGLGAVEAMNLDGGGSSMLIVNGELVNLPAGNVDQREVMSALVTYCY
ncbi:MAG: phosphodiester glycosidase family protein [Gemmatimonadota bacterium]|nr:phosphodiester glycosidase family protein [Gemmatimonadota bacterium]